MNAFRKRRLLLRQKGIAYVELALILLLTSFILPVVLLFARVFYHYNVIKQATQDAANYVAALPRGTLSTSAGMSAARERSQTMVIAAIAASGITPPEELHVEMRCNAGGMCLSSVPVTDVQVLAGFVLFDAFWMDTSPWLSDDGGSSWSITAVSSATSQN